MSHSFDCTDRATDAQEKLQQKKYNLVFLSSTTLGLSTGKIKMQWYLGSLRIPVYLGF